MCFQSLLIMLKHLVFDEHIVLWLEITFLVCQVGGWVVELNENITNSAPNSIGLGLSLAKSVFNVANNIYHTNKSDDNETQ